MILTEGWVKRVSTRSSGPLDPPVDPRRDDVDETERDLRGAWKIGSVATRRGGGTRLFTALGGSMIVRIRGWLFNDILSVVGCTIPSRV